MSRNMISAGMRDRQTQVWRSLASIASGPMASASIASLALQAAVIVLGFGQAIIMARLLGATDYGMFSVAAGVSTILAAIAALGFDQYAVPELSRLRADGDARTARAFIRFVSRSVLATSMLAGGGLAVMAMAAEAGAQPGWRTTFMLAGALTPLTAMLMVGPAQLRGLGAVVFSQIPVALVRPCAMISIMAVLWATGPPIDAPHGMTAWILASGMAVLVMFASLSRRISALEAGGPGPARTRGWLMGAAPFFGSTVVVMMSAQVNTLMLAAMAGPEAAGLYQPIAFLAPVVVLPITALFMPFGPRIAELWHLGEEESLMSACWVFSATAFVGSSIIGTAVLLFGEQVLAMFGQEFVAAAPALAWVVTGQIIFVALITGGVLLAMTGSQRLVLTAQVLGLALNVFLAAILVPAYGIEGAAMSFAAGAVTGSAAMLVWALRRFAFDPSLLGAVCAALRRSRDLSHWLKGTAN